MRLLAGALLATIALTACGGGDESRPSGTPEASSGPVELEPQDPVDPDEVRNSGRTISGVYTLQTPAPPVVAGMWTFTADGTYTRTRTLDGGRGDRTDSGSYVIDPSNRLVLYLEQRGDARLSWAERSTVTLSGDLQTSIVLTKSDGSTETLMRSGDAPPGG